MGECKNIFQENKSKFYPVFTEPGYGFTGADPEKITEIALSEINAKFVSIKHTETTKPFDPKMAEKYVSTVEISLDNALAQDEEEKTTS